MKKFSALEQAKQMVDKIKNYLLDVPFILATNKYNAGKTIRPNIPFNENDWVTEAQYQKELQQTHQPELDLYEPNTMTTSASFRPFMLPPTTSDLDVRQTLTNLGFRPAAVEYLSRFPVKVGEKYMNDPNAAGEAYENFVGVTPQAATDPAVLKHEYLHESPTTLNPTSRFSQILMNILYPQLNAQKNEFTQRWGQEYMQRPGALQQEEFAENRFPPAYYYHILENPNTPANSPAILNAPYNPWVMGTQVNQ